MSDRLYNVLFLCTQNSARSIMAQCVLERLGAGKFRAFSAGSHPAPRVNPHAIALLELLDHPTGHLRAKGWDEFAGPGAPHMDFVFTVCDAAAGETCPVWPGQPISAHWPFPDPAAFQGKDTQRSALFADVYGRIHNRIGIFVNLPVAALDRLALQRRLDDIGGGAPERA